MEKILRDELVRKAVASKKKAYAPYSKFRVGAAVYMEGGDVFTGCNVENASYGLSICAERNAIFRAVYAGNRKILAVAVATDDHSFITPCGACRQVIAEFATPTTTIILSNAEGKTKTVPFRKIFPVPPALEKLKKTKK